MSHKISHYVNISPIQCQHIVHGPLNAACLSLCGQSQAGCSFPPFSLLICSSSVRLKNLFEVNAPILYQIEVWALTRPPKSIHLVVLKPCLCSCSWMLRVIVLLEYKF